MTPNDISLYRNKCRLIEHYFAQTSTVKLLPADENKTCREPPPDIIQE